MGAQMTGKVYRLKSETHGLSDRKSEIYDLSNRRRLVDLNLRLAGHLNSLPPWHLSSSVHGFFIFNITMKSQNFSLTSCLLLGKMELGRILRKV